MGEPRALRSRFLRFAVVAVALLALAALAYRSELARLWHLSNLFDPDRIVHNFQHMDENLDWRTIERGDEVFELARGRYSLPPSFVYAGRPYDTQGQP